MILDDLHSVVLPERGAYSAQIVMDCREGILFDCDFDVTGIAWSVEVCAVE